MNAQPNTVLDFLLFKIYARLPRTNAFALHLRKQIREKYFKSRITDNTKIDAAWLERYFDLLIWFKGVCYSVTADEAVGAIVSRLDINKKNIVHTRINASSDLAMLYQVWNAEEYKAVIDYMLPYTIGGARLNIIDAGANVGYTTLYLKNIFVNAHIVSLEPDSSNFDQLMRNISNNKLKNVKPLQAGLWKNQAYLTVGRNFRDGSECSFFVEESASPTDLLGYGLEDIMANEKWEIIDLLKMDIEGAERYLFESSEKAQKVLQKVRFIALEIHDEFNIRPDIYRYFKENNFEIFESGEITYGRNKRLVPKSV